ncbi:MAG TPA: MBL fold metallo-hydrolase [Mycobacteriales bacterium]|nr:MBL fold metallo-hydrolase [Mycobacteriales bacterium]
MNEARSEPVEDWTAPGVFEVAPGVHRIPLPLPNDGLRAVNVYAVHDGDRLVLIDSGWAIPQARQRLADALQGLGRSLADVSRFLITHVHRDHYTQAIGLRREFGSTVSLGAGERQSLAVIQAPGRPPLEPQLHQLRLYGAAGLAEQIAAGLAAHRGTDRSDWESPDDWLEPGVLTLAAGRTLAVIETPGHTRGHVVFHDVAAGLLFAGDHVLPTITPSIGFEPVLSPNPLGDFLAALAKVRALPDAVLLPAHGDVTGSVHARIDELVAHHGARLDQTIAALASGVDTAAAVAGELRWTRRLRTLSELDSFNQMLAVAETGAHLDLLLAQGRLTRVVEEGCYRYRLS